MTERLLQYIWQFQYFNKNNLQTTDNQSIYVIQPGIYNINQGPDFLNGKIRIADTVWAGSIELHINSSDWRQHKHSDDKNYNNVILHVVWDHNADLKLPFPTIELQYRVSKILLTKYSTLMQGAQFIPCEKQISTINSLTMVSWKERMAVERLQHKARYVETLLQKNNHHWEETFWWMLARNFGTRINSDAFEQIAQSISINILAKHKNQLLQLEALLMGQAGFLDVKFKEDYPIMLQKEFHFLRQKYKLKKIHAPLFFLRMRPANFPTVRLAQLAALIHKSTNLFSIIKEIPDFTELENLFVVTANDYWHYHYVFDEATGFKKKPIGIQMLDNILINTVIPVIYAYGYFNNKENLKNKALQWLSKIPGENNSITKAFKLLGIENKTGWDSQALLQLKNEYCDKKGCLQCAVGNAILKEK